MLLLALWGELEAVGAALDPHCLVDGRPVRWALSAGSRSELDDDGQGGCELSLAAEPLTDPAGNTLTAQGALLVGGAWVAGADLGIAGGISRAFEPMYAGAAFLALAAVVIHYALRPS